MKQVIHLVLGAVVGVLVGSAAALIFNRWYSERFVAGDDDSNFLVSLLLFGVWPISIALGLWVGQRRFRRSLASPSSGLPPTSR